MIRIISGVAGVLTPFRVRVWVARGSWNNLAATLQDTCLHVSRSLTAQLKTDVPASAAPPKEQRIESPALDLTVGLPQIEGTFQLSILIGRVSGWMFLSDRDPGVSGAVQERVLSDIGWAVGLGTFEFRSLDWPVFALPSLPYQNPAVLIESIREILLAGAGGTLVILGKGLPIGLLSESGGSLRVVRCDVSVGTAIGSPSERRRLWKFLLGLGFQGS